MSLIKNQVGKSSSVVKKRAGKSALVVKNPIEKSGVGEGASENRAARERIAAKIRCGAW